MKNNNAEQIKSPGKRAAAYWFIDGLPEILFGLFFLIPGILVTVLAGYIRIQHPWIRWIGMLLGLLGYSIWCFHRPVLNFLKSRITYPRTGYAHPPIDFPTKAPSHPDCKILTPGTYHPADDNVSSFAGHTIPLMCFGVVPMGFLHSTSWGLPVVMSAIAAGIYILNRDGVRPYPWAAVLPIALAGFITSMLDLEPSFRVYIPMLICGVWLLVVGIWTLVGYLRANPKLDSGQEGYL